MRNELTTKNVEMLLGETYFDVQSHQGMISVYTRQNGDTCEGRPAPFDIAEARRLATLLRASGIVCKVVVVDEWVEINFPSIIA